MKFYTFKKFNNQGYYFSTPFASIGKISDGNHCYNENFYWAQLNTIPLINVHRDKEKPSFRNLFLLSLASIIILFPYLIFNILKLIILGILKLLKYIKENILI
jgi:hypothetical protein